jgi:hypothetical protein
MLSCPFPLKTVTQRLGQFLVAVLLGPRQVGKTSLDLLLEVNLPVLVTAPDSANQLFARRTTRRLEQMCADHWR